jgi:hypothetical protein
MRIRPYIGIIIRVFILWLIGVLLVYAIFYFGWGGTKLWQPLR